MATERSFPTESYMSTCCGEPKRGCLSHTQCDLIPVRVVGRGEGEGNVSSVSLRVITLEANPKNFPEPGIPNCYLGKNQLLPHRAFSLTGV